MVSKRSICIRCFQYDHHRSNCTNSPVVSCSECFGLNYLTKNCCKLPYKSDEEYYQGFRMVDPDNTRFFTDIPIGKTMVAALIDTNRSNTVIDYAVVTKLQTEQVKFQYTPPGTYVIEIPKPYPASLRAKMSLLPHDYRIILGMDYLSQRHVELKLNGIKISPQVDGFFTRSVHARFAANVVIASKTFLGVIDTALTQSKIDLSVLNLLCGSNATHTYDHVTRTCNVAMGWKEKKVDITFKVVRRQANAIILGTDSLKKLSCEMILDGITLNVNNPWKTKHSEGIEYAYNHGQGNELRRILVTERLPLLKDTMRPTLTRPIEMQGLQPSLAHTDLRSLFDYN